MAFIIKCILLVQHLLLQPYAINITALSNWQSVYKPCSLCGIRHKQLVQWKDIRVAQKFSVDVLQKEELCDAEIFHLCHVCYVSVQRFCQGQQYSCYNRGSKEHLAALLQPFRDVQTPTTTTTIDDIAFAQTVSETGDAMLNDKVMLLQAAYKTYNNKFTELQMSVDQPEPSLPSRSMGSFTFSHKVCHRRMYHSV